MRLPALLVLPLFASCIIDDTARPGVDVDMQAVTADVHRGMVQTENGALIPGTVISLPAKEEGTLLIVTEGSVELSDDTGNAWRPDGHSGRLARFDWSVLYEQALDNFLLTFGLINYNLPNGLEFPFGERGATSEVMFEVAADVWKGIVPRVRFNYDIDEVEGLYMQVGVSKGFRFGESWTLDLDLGLAWMDDHQAEWNYAQTPPANGLADLRTTARTAYAFDDHTSAAIELGYSRVMDDDFRDWFDVIDIDPDQTWIGLGLHWSY